MIDDDPVETPTKVMYPLIAMEITRFAADPRRTVFRITRNGVRIARNADPV
jgi:hypothetical protein